MMEAIRILKTTGVPLRRTVRVGFWEGEEQGLLGLARVRRGPLRHAPAAAGAGGRPAGRGRRRCAAARRGRSRRSPTTTSLSVYFNIDNGTGALRGIYLQGNDAAGADLPRVDGAVPQPRA